MQVNIGMEQTGITFSEHFIPGESATQTEQSVFVVSLHGKSLSNHRLLIYHCLRQAIAQKRIGGLASYQRFVPRSTKRNPNHCILARASRLIPIDEFAPSRKPSRFSQSDPLYFCY
jgi:hypothetical protein